MQGVFLTDAKVFYLSSTTVAGLHTWLPPSISATPLAPNSSRIRSLSAKSFAALASARAATAASTSSRVKPARRSVNSLSSSSRPSPPSRGSPTDSSVVSTAAIKSRNATDRPTAFLPFFVDTKSLSVLSGAESDAIASGVLRSSASAESTAVVVSAASSMPSAAIPVGGLGLGLVSPAVSASLACASTSASLDSTKVW